MSAPRKSLEDLFAQVSAVGIAHRAALLQQGFTARQLRELVRAGGVDVVCAWAKDGRSVASAPYEGIICDSWMVTLIKEAAFPERCGGGVGEEAWEASVCER